MEVRMNWSLDAPEARAVLYIPGSITLQELGEFEEAVSLQLKAVRRSLEDEGTTDKGDAAHE